MTGSAEILERRQAARPLWLAGKTEAFISTTGLLTRSECFERAYGVRITLDGGLIDREKYSLAFVNDETLDQMLSAIAYNGRLTVVRTEDGYSLRKRK